MSPNGIEHCMGFQIIWAGAGGVCPTIGGGGLVESFKPLTFTQHLSVE